MKLIARIEEALKYLNSNEYEDMIKRKDSVSFLTEEGIISNLFCGKLQISSSAKESDGRPIKNKVTKVFGKIDIEVDDKELYEAWGAAFNKQIENFLLSDGSLTKANQRT